MASLILTSPPGASPNSSAFLKVILVKIRNIEENKCAVCDKILSTKTSVGNNLWHFPALLRAHGLHECTCFPTLSWLLWAARTGMSPPLLKIPEVAATKVTKKINNLSFGTMTYQHRLLWPQVSVTHQAWHKPAPSNRSRQGGTTQHGAACTRIHTV